MDDLTSLTLEQLEAELTKVNLAYQNYIKNGLLEKARHKLPLLNSLEGEIASRTSL